jgi:hypothetical protein
MNENTFGLVACVALAGAILYESRRKPAATVARPGQSYTTPTSVAEQLARGVWGLISGNLAGQPKGITTENARTAFRQGELQAERTTTAWGGPSRSIVADDPNGWGLTDGTLTAPVYDPGNDFVQNPFMVNAL